MSGGEGMPSLVGKARPDAKLTLLCCHHAGGSAATFARWQRELPASVELLAVELPRRGGRGEPAFKNMEALLARLPVLLGSLSERPLVVFGHSMGALVGFECARILRSLGRPPVHLVVSSSPAPDVPRNIDPIGGFSDSEFTRELCRRYDGLPAELLNDAEMMAYLLPAIRSDVRLLESYEYRKEAPLSCPIDVLAGLDDPRLTRQELARWSLESTEGANVRSFPGGHFYFHHSWEPFMGALLLVIERYLVRLRPELGEGPT